MKTIYANLCFVMVVMVAYTMAKPPEETRSSSGANQVQDGENLVPAEKPEEARGLEQALGPVNRGVNTGSKPKGKGKGVTPKTKDPKRRDYVRGSYWGTLYPEGARGLELAMGPVNRGDGTGSRPKGSGGPKKNARKNAGLGRRYTRIM